jgi:hypothetical protein
MNLGRSGRNDPSLLIPGFDYPLGAGRRQLYPEFKWDVATLGCVLAMLMASFELDMMAVYVLAVCLAQSGPELELQGRSDTEHSGILERSPGKRSRRICGAPARMDNVLKVWLHRPAFPDLVLVHGGDQSFK